MSGDLDPIMGYDIFQCDVTAQTGKSPFSGKVSDIHTLNVIHAMFFKCTILIGYSFEMFVDLPNEELSFEVLKGEEVKLEYLEIALDPPWIFILFKFSLGNFAVQVPGYFIEEPGYIQGEQVDNLVEDIGAWIVVNAHKLQHSHQLIRVEGLVVELGL